MLDYRHMMTMTDDIGMLQFSRQNEPDPDSGYTLDDNARAFMVSLYMDEGYEYAFKYASWMDKAQNTQGWSNYYAHGQFRSCFNSEDSIGRALLACCLGVTSPWPIVNKICTNMLEKNIPRARHFHSPRAIAYTLVGLSKLGSLNDMYTDIITRLSGYLISLYQSTQNNNWLWFENYLTYCNGILPQAMFAAYNITGDKKALKIGRDSLGFLTETLFREGYLNIIGNQHWYKREHKVPLFDQQPVDAASALFACFEAYQTIGEAQYLEFAALAHLWYRGRNIHGLSLYSPKTGGCFDALTHDGVNLNQGAESCLSLLLADTLMVNSMVQKLDADQTS